MFYISSGALTAMYTLREQYDETIVVEGERITVTRDHHIQNLSTDAAKAKARAAVLGYSVAAPEFTLQEIKRRDADAMAAAREAQFERDAISQRAKVNAELDCVAAGRFPFGRSRGVNIDTVAKSKADRDGWIGYWIRQDSSATEKALSLYLRKQYPEIAKTIDFKFKPGHYGTVGKREKSVPVTLIASYSFDGYYGRTYIEKSATEDGLQLVYKGSAVIMVSKGGEYVIDFTVKEHGEYEEADQTMIQRVKLLD